MEREVEIIRVSEKGQIPSLDAIRSLPRTKRLKLIFEEALNIEREAIGDELKEKLNGFLVGVHVLDPEINISKLITSEEVINNQDFFEQCAKDYRELGEKLIFELAAEHQLDLKKDSPWVVFWQLKNTKNARGLINEWDYYLHGYHCNFSNRQTGQIIEVPLVYGLEFGDLDPYFFSEFIKSSKDYYPLPVDIYEDYCDGEQIINTMLTLGKFERINSNFTHREGVAVTDRKKIEIKPLSQDPKITLKKKKFSFYNLFRFKN